MDVDIDQAGHHEALRMVEHFVTARRRRCLGGSADKTDPPVIDDNRLILADLVIETVKKFATTDVLGHAPSSASLAARVTQL